MKRTCFILFFSFLVVDAWGRDSAHEKLAQLGFTLLQGTPIDFELAGLDDSKQSLQSFRGKWIWLVFWATWCGPCTDEMPALESLYRKFKQKGLSVLGVSVDQDRNAVQRFVNENKITFPIVTDGEGSVSSKYRASALPTLYVISPDWKLVGILRGARDWSSQQTSEDLSVLLQNQKYGDTDIGMKMAEEDGALSLPNNLVPPQLEVSLNPNELKQGAIVPLTVEVTWKGNPKDYLIKVPRITLPTGISQADVSSSSTSADENTTLRYHFPIKLETEGNHKIGPIELSYSPRQGGKELFARIEGVSIIVEKKNWARVVIPVLCAIFVGAGWLLFQKSKKPLRRRHETYRSTG